MPDPSFRFRLERVRALRERSEDMAKQELAGSMIRARRSEEQLAAAESQLALARDAHLATSSVPVSAGDLIARQAYLERAELQTRRQQIELAHHEAEVNGKREALGQAARARQTLERLKERRRADHARESARREGIALDEMALNGFRRSAA